jgi:4-amino-4-deoxy-L-arabinose transferase-like glycosyltransferase
VSSERSALRLVSALTWILTGMFFAIAALVAVVIPIHAQDALAFGEWSRLISEDWHLRQAAATAQGYGRPLFYVIQGWLWGAFGFSETVGRLLSGLFSGLLLGACVWLVRDRPWGSVAGALAALALIATPVFAAQVVSGLTDLPVAGLVALSGALVWGRRPGPIRAGLAGLAATLAMLAKPSALLALAGLALAQLLVSEPLRSRLLMRVAPLGAGIAIGLVYDLIQARYVNQSLRAFLQAGVNTDYYRALASEARRYALLDGSWFGEGLRVAAFFALAYVALRLLTASHRSAVLAGLPLALLASWLGPWVAAGESHFAVGALHSAGAAASAVGTAVFLGFGALASREAVASQRELARFAVWAVPTAVAWGVYGAYDFRLLAPAWPPLIALIVLSALPAASAIIQRWRMTIGLPLALFAIVVAENVYNVDGLGKSGWSELRRTPVSEWSDEARMRAIVMPAFSRALNAVRPEMRREDLLISAEGAFRFFYPGRVEQAFPSSCGHLARFRILVLLTDEGSRRYMEDFFHVSGDPAYWANCHSPRLKQLTDGSEGYAVFRIGD